MDVVCDRCKAEYEFDDALVSERGTTVKCTNCGNQFKIYRPGAAEGSHTWALRRPDGTVIPFDSLAVLQKWILEGRVSKTDEIARGSESWKALGAITELDSFFATAEARKAETAPKPSATPAPTPADATVGGLPPSPKAPFDPVSGSTARFPASSSEEASDQLAQLASRQGEGFRTAPSGTPLPPVAPLPEPQPPAAPAVAPRSSSPEVPPSSLSDPGTVAPVTSRKGRSAVSSDAGARPVQPRPSTRPFAELQNVDSTTDDDEDEYKPVRPLSGSRGVLIGVTLGLLLAGAAGLGVWRAGLLGTPAPTAAPVAQTPTPASGPQLDAARRLARQFTRKSLEDAHEALTLALALAPDDATVHAARAEVLAAWAELLRQRADDLEARSRVRGADVATLRAEASLLRRDANERLERARAESAVAERGLERLAPPARAEAEGWLADVARIAGDLPGARRRLEIARRTPVPETDLFAALVERDSGAEPAAIEGLRAATTREGDQVRARLALARLLASQGRADDARRELDAVLQAHADHEDARSLRDALSRNEPPMVARGASAPTPAVDAGTTPAAPATPTAPTNVANVAPQVRPTTPAAAPDEHLPRDYRHLVEEGDRFQTEGRSSQARERFRQALAVRPNGTEALTGMGYVALDQRELSTAVSYFRQALDTNRRYSEALVGLGEAYTSMGHYQQAIDTYNEYLQYYPGGPHATMARRQVEALQDRVRPRQEPSTAPREDAQSSGTSGSSGADPARSAAPPPGA